MFSVFPINRPVDEWLRFSSAILGQCHIFLRQFAVPTPKIEVLFSIDHNTTHLTVDGRNCMDPFRSEIGEKLYL